MIAAKISPAATTARRLPPRLPRLWRCQSWVRASLSAVIETATSDLRALVERLEALSARRLALRSAQRGGRQLVLASSPTTSAGTSGSAPPLSTRPWSSFSLARPAPARARIFNTIAGRAASSTGVLRPTTRVAVVLVHPDDQAALVDGALAGIPADQVRLVTDDAIAPGPRPDRRTGHRLARARQSRPDRPSRRGGRPVRLRDDRDPLRRSGAVDRPGARARAGPAAARRGQPDAARRRRPSGGPGRRAAAVRRGWARRAAGATAATRRPRARGRARRRSGRRRRAARRGHHRAAARRDRAACVPTARRASRWRRGR